MSTLRKRRKVLAGSDYPAAKAFHAPQRDRPTKHRMPPPGEDGPRRKTGRPSPRRHGRPRGR